MQKGFILVNIGLYVALIAFISSTEGSESEKGICTDLVCCPATCGSCSGKAGCDLLPGGASNCCEEAIVSQGRTCNLHGPPCIRGPTQVSRPGISNAICTDSVCCKASCGVCAGRRCPHRPGGRRNCCGKAIIRVGRTCDTYGTPCILGPTQVSRPWVSNAICTYSVCCKANCGVCGGAGCELRPGGASNCCERPIISRGRTCDIYEAPCILGRKQIPPPQGVSNAVCTSSVCCKASCRVCGGVGCARRPGGRRNCCETNIIREGRTCRANRPPCILGTRQIPPPRGVSNAVCTSSVCCKASCRVCGGSSCGQRLGGALYCCPANIRLSGRFCGTSPPPCIRGPPTSGSGGSSNGQVDVDVDVEVNVTVT